MGKDSGSERKQETNHGATPFDTAFKAEVSRLKEFLVPLINEIYGEELDVSVVDVVREANEHYVMSLMREEDTGAPERLSDSCLRIGGKHYHMECQSTEDGDILIRLVEYNMQIGLENLQMDESRENLIVDLPQSSLLMLRSGRPGSEKITEKTIIYRHDDLEMRIKVPVLHVQAYSAQEIYEKKLYFLIPFYSVRFEKDMEKLAGIKENRLELKKQCDKIYNELDQWFQRIRTAYEAAKITEAEAKRLVDISRSILNHIVRKAPRDAAERLVSTLSGEKFEFSEDREYRQGKADGRAEGAQLLARLLKSLTPGSEEYNAALDATDEERMDMYRKYHIIEDVVQT